jgi:hypothetical protein
VSEKEKDVESNHLWKDDEGRMKESLLFSLKGVAFKGDFDSNSSSENQRGYAVLEYCIVER